MSLRKSLIGLAFAGASFLGYEGRASPVQIHEQPGARLIFKENFDDEDVNGRYDEYIFRPSGQRVGGIINGGLHLIDETIAPIGFPLPDVFEIKYDMPNLQPGSVDSAIALLNRDVPEGSEPFRRQNIEFIVHLGMLESSKLYLYGGSHGHILGEAPLPYDSVSDINISIQRDEVGTLDVFFNDAHIFSGEGLPLMRYIGLYDSSSLYDNFQIWTIPEPSTLGLLVAGAVATSFRRRNKNYLGTEENSDKI